ncbi:MAG: D-2-hydroxyacid dehydrogenase, partial [Clostridia bacterium]|nr:D-2-hydroxyacid dehydrogenase [Clostridia bacterium]
LTFDALYRIIEKTIFEVKTMKIAFRRVPFNEAQQRTLNNMIISAGHEPVVYGTDMPTIDELRDCIAFIGHCPAELTREMKNLQWLQIPCDGAEAYCPDVYANPDVVLTNTSGAFGISISEFMLTGLLMMLRNLPTYMKNAAERKWQYVPPCRSIWGSTIAVIGMGDIGSNFARRVKALGATVRGVRRTPRPTENFDAVYGPDQIIEAVTGADAVVLSLPNTKETKQLISREVIAAMRPDAILVNCGRGITVDQTALIEALQNKRIGGAVLDVYEVEPLPTDSPLWELDNVILTPHVSGLDADYINAGRIYEICRDNLAAYLKGEPLTNVVDRERGY